jgi:hypothetical protein
MEEEERVGAPVLRVESGDRGRGEREERLVGGERLGRRIENR